MRTRVRRTIERQARGGKSQRNYDDGAPRVPKDLIVATPEELAWRQDTIGTIEWPAWREGKVVYARARFVRRQTAVLADR